MTNHVSVCVHVRACIHVCVLIFDLVLTAYFKWQVLKMPYHPLVSIAIYTLFIFFLWFLSSIVKTEDKFDEDSHARSPQIMIAGS